LLMAVVLLYSLASCFPRVDNEVRDVDSVAQVNEVNDVAAVDGESNLPAPGASPPPSRGGGGNSGGGQRPGGKSGVDQTQRGSQAPARNNAPAKAPVSFIHNPVLRNYT
jgi:hypothetical protein